jgi:hypothetical protein
MFNRRQKDYLGALQDVLRTESGKRLFKYLEQDYVQASAIAESTELTYLKLGQKELIQGLLQDAKIRPEDLEPIKVINHNEDYLQS